MDDFSKAALTALFAVVVYVAGKLVERAWIDPVLEVRRVIGEIAFALKFYGNVSADGAQAMAAAGREDQAQRILDQALEGSKALRERASQLTARAYTVPAYRLAVRLRLLPPGSEIERASTNLIGYSNTIASNSPQSWEMHERYQMAIEEALGLKRRWGAGTVERPVVAPKRRDGSCPGHGRHGGDEWPRSARDSHLKRRATANARTLGRRRLWSRSACSAPVTTCHARMPYRRGCSGDSWQSPEPIRSAEFASAYRVPACAGRAGTTTARPRDATFASALSAKPATTDG